METAQTKALGLFPAFRRLECTSAKTQHVKVKLRYFTYEPSHIRSYILQHNYGCEGPFVEDICVLLPQAKVYPQVSCFTSLFARLQVLGVVSKSAQLTGFIVQDEDESTLAYVLD